MGAVFQVPSLAPLLSAPLLSSPLRSSPLLSCSFPLLLLSSASPLSAPLLLSPPLLCAFPLGLLFCALLLFSARRAPCAWVTRCCCGLRDAHGHGRASTTSTPPCSRSCHHGKARAYTCAVHSRLHVRLRLLRVAGGSHCMYGLDPSARPSQQQLATWEEEARQLNAPPGEGGDGEDGGEGEGREEAGECSRWRERLRPPCSSPAPLRTHAPTCTRSRQWAQRGCSVAEC